MTRAQMKALRAAASWTLDGEEWQDDWMRREAGRNWYAHLRKALAEVSRELARDKVTKRSAR
jgi:hypothetical protein